MASFTLVREVSAPPETVFDVLTDHRRYADISRLRKSELEREGDPAPNGVGAIRVLTAVGPPIREEVVAYEPPRRFSYKVLSGLPIRDHLGTVSLEPCDGRTRITYALKAIPTVPFAGGLVMVVLRRAVTELLDGVASEAERRAPAGA
ncbi:MAG TPA: SRPBCC family protein [Solirubrobacterales bacterium]|nr:SRPBCC family protein [Solirubrobacterales bacterium]